MSNRVETAFAHINIFLKFTKIRSRSFAYKIVNNEKQFLETVYRVQYKGKRGNVLQ